MQTAAFKYLERKHGPMFAICWYQNRRLGLSPQAAYKRITLAIEFMV